MVLLQFDIFQVTDVNGITTVKYFPGDGCQWYYYILIFSRWLMSVVLLLFDVFQVRDVSGITTVWYFPGDGCQWCYYSLIFSRWGMSVVLLQFDIFQVTDVSVILLQFDIFQVTDVSGITTVWYFSGDGCQWCYYHSSSCQCSPEQLTQKSWRKRWLLHLTHSLL